MKIVSQHATRNIAAVMLPTVIPIMFGGDGVGVAIYKR